MFYGRISDIYLAVITLTVSLIFYHLIVSTSDDYKIGKSSIGGYNGIPGLPPINLPGDTAIRLGFEGKYYLSVIVMFLTYFGIRWLLETRFGRVAISIRENEARTELIGYDARAYKLALYTVGAGNRWSRRGAVRELGRLHQPGRIQHILYRADHRPG